MPTIYETADEYKAQLKSLEDQAVAEIIQSYGAVYKSLSKRINELIKELERRIDEGEDPVIEQWAFEFKRISELKLHIESELKKFGELGDKQITGKQTAAIKYATKHAEDLAGKIANQAGTRITWNQVSTDLLKQMTGNFQAESPLYKMFATRGEEVARKTMDDILAGLTAGYSAKTIAQGIRQNFTPSLTHAMVIARTEINRAYTETTRAVYNENPDVILGYIRKSARTPKTCAACWALDGAKYGLHEPLPDHPNGRCFMIPIVKGAENSEVYKEKDGAAAFRALPATDQKKVLGTVKYELYKNGELTLHELVNETRDPQWGVTITEKSLVGLYGESKAAELKAKYLWEPKNELEKLQIKAEKKLEEVKKKLTTKKKELEKIKPAEPPKPTIWNGTENKDKKLAPPPKGTLSKEDKALHKQYAKGADPDAIAATKAFQAKTVGTPDGTFYHCSTEGFKETIDRQFNTIGDSLYLGKDPRVLWDIYGMKAFDEDMHPDATVYEFQLSPDAKILQLKDKSTFEKIEAEAKKLFPKAQYPIKELALSQGYDGLVYFDPFTTGEEWAIYNYSKLTLKGQIDWTKKAITEGIKDEAIDWLDKFKEAPNDPDEVLDAIHNNRSFMRNQPGAVEASIKNYTGSDYESINKTLRKGSTNFYYPNDKQDYMNIYKTLENAPETQKTVVVYRGSMSYDPKAKPGDIVIDKGFMSTTINPGAAFNGTQWEILIPAGSRNLGYVGDVSAFPGEYEMIINSGSQLKVLEVQTVKNPYMGDNKKYICVYLGRR